MCDQRKKKRGKFLIISVWLFDGLSLAEENVLILTASGGACLRWWYYVYLWDFNITT